MCHEGNKKHATDVSKGIKHLGLRAGEGGVVQHPPVCPNLNVLAAGS